MDAREGGTCTRGGRGTAGGRGLPGHAAQIKERLQTVPCAIVIIIEITPIATHTAIPKCQYHFRFSLPSLPDLRPAINSRGN